MILQEDNKLYNNEFYDIYNISLSELFFIINDTYIYKTHIILWHFLKKGKKCKTFFSIIFTQKKKNIYIYILNILIFAQNLRAFSSKDPRQ